MHKYHQKVELLSKQKKQENIVDLIKTGYCMHSDWSKHHVFSGFKTLQTSHILLFYAHNINLYIIKHIKNQRHVSYCYKTH